MPDFMDKIKDTISRSRSRNRDPLEGEGAAAPKHHSHLNPEFSDVPEEGDHEQGSRGRSYVPSGRGGVGNMSHSRGRQPNPNQVDEDNAVVEKARSTSRTRSGSRDVQAGGRGGMGNMRSPSRDPVARAKADALTIEEHEVQKKWEEDHKDDTISAGRGGMGNMGSHGVKMHDAVDQAKEEGVTED
ncbi:hypothetical protein RQP46_008295 [Phenoliferia psychrophenolica]